MAILCLAQILAANTKYPEKDSMYLEKDSFCHEQGLSQSWVSTNLFVYIYFMNMYIFGTCPFLLWIRFQC
jgi:hypothetical protein